MRQATLIILFFLGISAVVAQDEGDISPDLALFLEQVEQDLASQLGGVSLLTGEEALNELDGAFDQLERRALHRAATSLVENGLETEEQRKIHRDLLASKR